MQNFMIATIIVVGVSPLGVYQPLTFLVDKNECKALTSVCHAEAECFNNYGSYTCQCNTGFTGNGKNCTGESFKETVQPT